jgi:hypothetical protein
MPLDLGGNEAATPVVIQRKMHGEEALCGVIVRIFNPGERLLCPTVIPAAGFALSAAL